jgi:hypothetical protein
MSTIAATLRPIPFPLNEPSEVRPPALPTLSRHAVTRTQRECGSPGLRG